MLYQMYVSRNVEILFRFWDTQMLHVGNIYLHFALTVAIVHLM